VTDDPRIDWGQGEWLEEVQRLEAELEQAEKLAGLNEALADGYAKALWEAEARLEKADKLVEALRTADGFLADPSGDPVRAINFTRNVIRVALADWHAS
jgi:hypothetical protein